MWQWKWKRRWSGHVLRNDGPLHDIIEANKRKEKITDAT